MKEVRKLFDEKGQLEEEAEYEDNRLHGSMKRYYSDGQLKEMMHFLRGVADGACVWYYQNGKVKREMNYSVGQLSGEMKAYTESGTLKESWLFENGEIVGRGAVYHDSGILKKEVSFNHGEVERVIEHGSPQNRRKVTLYSKDGCHLCERVQLMIEHVRKQINFDFEKVDITQNPDLFNLYQHDIPVVRLNQKEIARHDLTEERFLRILQSAD